MVAFVDLLKGRDCASVAAAEKMSVSQVRNNLVPLSSWDSPPWDWGH